MRQALVFHNLPLKCSVVRPWIAPNVEDSKHFIDGIRLKKHMQKILVELNLLRGSQEFDTEQTLTTIIKSSIGNV
jgi:hypothetical protein